MSQLVVMWAAGRFTYANGGYGIERIRTGDSRSPSCALKYRLVCVRLELKMWVEDFAFFQCVNIGPFISFLNVGICE